MVVMRPITVINNKPARNKKVIKHRPFTDERLQVMHEWIDNKDWSEVTHEHIAHKKAEILQKLLVEKYEEFFPEKDVTIFSDDQPFFSNKLRIMKRRKGRVYSKYRRSEKWKKMNEKYELELDKVKKEFYNKKIKNLRKVNPKYWYREFKKLTSFDQHKSDEIVVEDIK